MSDMRFTSRVQRYTSSVVMGQYVVLSSTGQCLSREFEINPSTHLWPDVRSPRRVHRKAAAWGRVWCCLPGGRSARELFVLDVEG